MYCVRWIRSYHSKHMRTHQSTIARLDNIFQPIESMFEDQSSSCMSGAYAAKRRQELMTRPLPSITRYIEAQNLGSPRSARDFRSLVNKKRLAVRFLDQLKPKAKFLCSAIQENELPLATLPEVAVVGRSNSGKSTLINAIVGTRCCAVENKPGSTKSLNFYRIGDPPLLTFVDVPGFGFAYASPETRTQWTEFALWYLKARRNLRLAILVADARHGLADSDLELISFFRGNKIDFRIALNKCDLVHSGDLAKRLTILGRDLQVPESQLLDRIVPVSALRDQGVERLRNIVESCKMKREVVIAGKKKHVMDLLEERRLRKAQLRADRNARRQTEFADMFGCPEQETPLNSPEIESRETEAYKPDTTSILKRSAPDDRSDINMLEFENFVSKDEIENLGLRGRHPVPSEGNTEYESKMKLDHSLNWKMRLDLGQGSSVPPSVSREDKSPQEDLSALGFITTATTTEMPKGIAKWRVVGMKPVKKTSRAKKRPDLISYLSKDRK